MSLLQKIGAAVLLALLIVTGYGWWRTNQAASSPIAALTTPAAQPPAAAGSAVPAIDQRTYHIAQRLAEHATTPEEQTLARQAVQLADHELDLAFAGAMRHVEAHPPVLSAAALAIQARLKRAQAELDGETADLKRLTAQLAKAADSAKAPLQDQLTLAQAQQELDQDEVNQLNDQLMQAGGNAHQRITMMQQQHEATEHNRPPALPASAGALGSLEGLVGTVREWHALHRKRFWLAWAQKRAADSAAQLAAGAQQLASEFAAARKSKRAAAGSATAPQSQAQARASAGPGATGWAADGPASAPTLLTLTRRLAAEQSRLTIRDQRIRDRQRLAATYGEWGAVVDTEADAVLHSGLTSVAVVLVALLLLLFAGTWLEKLLSRARIDRRQIATLRSVVGVSLQIVAVVVILLMLIGIPQQLGTMIGLAGAGLTVALKDFIIGFLGWFVLMGRHGIRLGDWVEINGVSGEVIELGLFHTVLLETGNWTDPGHPTGRRVTFTNSFAIEGHYFNFSTSGQWLWDELVITVPYDRDPHAVAAAIGKEVNAATAESSRQAESEWLRASRGQRGTAISAQPAIAVRPAAGGIDIAVRYVTRATERLALRARLYQMAVQLLAKGHPHATAS